MKRRIREAAAARMKHAMEMAIQTAGIDANLAQRYAAMARRVSTRHRVRMPYVMRVMFCRRCQMFIPPGILSRVRMTGGSPKAIRTTCRYCGHTYRKVLSPKHT